MEYSYYFISIRRQILSSVLLLYSRRKCITDSLQMLDVDLIFDKWQQGWPFILDLLAYVAIDDPVHQIEADKTYRKHNSRVLINGTGRKAANPNQVVGLIDLKLSGCAMWMLAGGGCSRHGRASR